MDTHVCVQFVAPAAASTAEQWSAETDQCVELDEVTTSPLTRCTRAVHVLPCAAAGLMSNVCTSVRANTTFLHA